MHDRGRDVAALGAVLACMLAWCPSAFSLNPALDISQYVHTAWKIREGFTKGTINAIAQTPDGYLWLGTDFGLLRFDGVRNVPWQPPSGQHLPSTQIWSLLTSRDGTLWIGTSKGLAAWKGSDLTQYAELAGQAISRLLEDREGSVWAGGLAATGKLCTIQKRSIECYGDDGGLGRGVHGLYEDRKGRLWAGVSNGLWRWKPGLPEFHPLPGEVDGIQGFDEDDDGALIIGTRSGIRRLVDGKTTAHPVQPNLGEFNARRLLRDREGGLWIGTSGRGLVHVHQGRTDVFAQSDGLSDDHVEAIVEDREGSIWVATNGGLDRFRDVAVATVSVNQGLSNTTVTSALATGDGSVWLGTFDGLNRWNNGQMMTYRQRSAGPFRRSAEQRLVREIVDDRLPDSSIETLFQDRRGRVWVFTFRGVGYLEGGRFVSQRDVPGGNVHSVAEDAAKHLWIANQDLGLFQIVRDSVVQRIPWARLGRKDHDNALALVGDPLRGGLWIGFVAGGVVYFADGQVRESYEAADGLGVGRVTQLQVDQHGTLWASTESGLSRLRHGRVSTLTSKNGLPCDAVHWAIEDDAHSLWLYTPCGLVRIERPELDVWAAAVDRDKDAKRTIHVTVFDSSDGVRSVALAGGYSPLVAKSVDGRLWFTGFDGVSVVDPRHLPFNNLPPPVHIEQIVADRKTYETTSNTNGRVTLPALSRDLQIDYAALSLVAPEKMRFRYKLESHDTDWQDVGTRRQAFYNDLSPGNYRFRVIASNNSGVWNEMGAALDFSIAPAYYQTAWFRTLAVVMFLSLLWSAYRIRLRVIERHQAEITALNESLMKAQEQERTRIAGELHDGVIQQISALSLVLGTGKRQPEADAKKTMADVQRKLIEVGTEVRQLSHNLHPPMLKDAGLPEALRGYCEEFSRVRYIAVSCHADDSVQGLSRGAALAIFRIAQEAMGNAVTHGAARHVDVRVARSNGLVALTVTDDGKGFDANRIGGLRGLGLINMRERARQLNGTFELNSEPGQGTTVRVTIPFRPEV